MSELTRDVSVSAGQDQMRHQLLDQLVDTATALHQQIDQGLLDVPSELLNKQHQLLEQYFSIVSQAEVELAEVEVKKLHQLQDLQQTLSEMAENAQNETRAHLRQHAKGRHAGNAYSRTARIV